MRYLDTLGNTYETAELALQDFCDNLPDLTEEETETVFQFTQHDADAAHNLEGIAYGITYAGLSDKFEGYPVATPAPMLEDSYITEATASAVATLIWSETIIETMDDSGPRDGDPYDEHFSTDDLAEDYRTSLEEDIAEFLLAHAADVADMKPAQFGHDFILTSNGHGAGFWDSGLGDRGDRLTEACRPYGYTLTVSGDGEGIELV